jgi:hypothetical protein
MQLIFFFHLTDDGLAQYQPDIVLKAGHTIF